MELTLTDITPATAPAMAARVTVTELVTDEHVPGYYVNVYVMGESAPERMFATEAEARAHVLGAVTSFAGGDWGDYLSAGIIRVTTPALVHVSDEAPTCDACDADAFDMCNAGTCDWFYRETCARNLHRGRNERARVQA